MVFCPRTKHAGRNVGGDNQELQSFWARGVETRVTLGSKAIDSHGEPRTQMGSSCGVQEGQSGALRGASEHRRNPLHC